MMTVVRYLKKKGLKFKHASCMNIRVEYFRVDMLQSIIQDNIEEIRKSPKLWEQIQTIRDELVFFKRPKNSEKLKYPQVLEPTKTDRGKFASFKFDTTQSHKSYVFVVILLIIIGVLFPLWPYDLKYGVWLIAVFLLVVIVGIILFRLVLYVLLASLGISFWLFPNIFGDEGVIDSFRPLYSIQKWENDIFSKILRAAAFSIFVYYCLSIYREPEFYLENLQSAKQVIKDLHDWGDNKIKGEAANFSQRAITMEQILNNTADAYQQQQVTMNGEKVFEDEIILEDENVQGEGNNETENNETENNETENNETEEIEENEVGDAEKQNENKLKAEEKA